jgi:hypothetical protein
MSMRGLCSVPIVAPAQVWSGLTTEAQAGAIQLMARLASNLIIQEPQPVHTEITPCLHSSHPTRSDQSTSNATP